MTQFDLEVDAHDLIRNDDFHQNLVGYIAMIEDNGPMRKIVERVCKSFTTGTDSVVFEVVPKTVS
jgi:hypothetical protein